MKGFGLLAKLFSWLMGRLFGGSQPSQEARATERAAVAETKLSQQVQANDQIAKAVQASRASDAAVAAHPDSLREPSPDSRD